MDERIDYFIALVEEKSFSKAAARMYVSQQCLSNYIKNIETHYNCRMFIRKPQLSLTPAGEVYYNAVKQIKHIELNLQEVMRDAVVGQCGILTIGIHLSRAPLILSKILPKFWEVCPRVRVDVQEGRTTDLMKTLKDGLVDVVFVINPDAAPDMIVTPLNEERMYLSISDKLLQEYFPTDYPACIDRFASEGVSLATFADVPFIRRQGPNTAMTMIDSYLIQKGITLNTRLQTNSSALRIAMCTQSYGATITNALRVYDINHHSSQSNTLVYSFPIQEMEAMRHCLVCRKGEYRSQFIDIFSKIAVKTIAEELLE